MSDGGPRNSSRQRAKCTPVVNRSFEHHTYDSTFWLGSTLILRVKGLAPTSRKDLRLDGCLEYPQAAKVLCIYKHPCLHRDSKPYGTAVDVANHYTGWVTEK
ncbi:uncharacterized protein TNCV_4038521 [Trichonephila clavipes]|nr:uncharacterized protein TNCV_4038521 [Trichonephila clavipes]